MESGICKMFSCHFKSRECNDVSDLRSAARAASKPDTRTHLILFFRPIAEVALPSSGRKYSLRNSSSSFSLTLNRLCYLPYRSAMVRGARRASLKGLNIMNDVFDFTA